MPATLAQRRQAVPQEPGDAAYAYLSEVNNRYQAYGIYSTDRLMFSPRNAHGWVLELPNAEYVAWAIPSTNVDTHLNTLRQWTRRADNALNIGDNWCIHHPSYDMPYPIVGQWVAATSSNRATTIVNETRYDCYHCAYQASVAACRANQRPYPLAYDECHAIIDDHLPNGFEVLTDALEHPYGVPTTLTIKDVTTPIALACGNCGRVGHSSRICANPPKVFDKVGIEIEGRFNNLRELRTRAESDMGTEGYHDCSVHSTPEPNSQARSWEFQTRPGSVREACQQLLNFYPDETDSSCGMHVHVSFKAVDITLINSTAFFAYFKQRWEDWGARMGLHPQSPFFRRLRGNNSYCRPAGERPYRISSQDRYSQLNFTSFEEHGTVECRLLPMFVRSSLAVAAVQELVDIYETFLANPAQFGHPGFDAETSLAPPSVKSEVLSSLELELPKLISSHEATEIELVEIAPAAPGTVRVCMPINQPITLASLAASVARLRSVA